MTQICTSIFDLLSLKYYSLTFHVWFFKGKNLDEILLRRESKQNMAPESRDE